MNQRQEEGWYLSFPVANAYEGSWVDFEIKGERVGAGPGGSDAAMASRRHLWLPKSPETYAYDADGNLTADGRWGYGWDGENRLVAMETRSELLPPAGLFPLAQKRRLEFGYDGQGRRVSKKVFNWNGSAWVLASSSLFLYDGWNLIAELTSLPSGAQSTQCFAWGLDLSGSLQDAGGVGGLLFSTGTSAPGSPLTAYCFSYDGNGNVIGLVDMATGTKSATYDYNAFGETIQSDGVASIANRFRFSTKYTDDETGLLYYGLRYYIPSLGRWLSKDPIGEIGGENLYGFVNQSPTGSIDSIGLAEQSVNSSPVVDARGNWHDPATGQFTKPPSLPPGPDGKDVVAPPGKIGTSSSLGSAINSVVKQIGKLGEQYAEKSLEDYIRTGAMNVRLSKPKARVAHAA